MRSRGTRLGPQQGATILGSGGAPTNHCLSPGLFQVELEEQKQVPSEADGMASRALGRSPQPLPTQVQEGTLCREQHTRQQSGSN